MNLVDVVVLAILALSALAGLSRGLVREVLGLAAWVGAGFVAFRYSPDLLPAAHGYIADTSFAQAATYIVTFVAALTVFSIAASVLGRLARPPGLGGLDRSLGLVFGLARGALIVVAAYIVGGWLLPAESWPLKVRQARSMPFVYQGASWVVDRLPAADRPALAAPPEPRQATAAELMRAPVSGRATGPAPVRD
jgi:membrane protein required for colicin V production